MQKYTVPSIPALLKMLIMVLVSFVCAIYYPLKFDINSHNNNVNFSQYIKVIPYFIFTFRLLKIFVHYITKWETCMAFMYIMSKIINKIKINFIKRYFKLVTSHFRVHRGRVNHHSLTDV